VKDLFRQSENAIVSEPSLARNVCFNGNHVLGDSWRNHLELQTGSSVLGTTNKQWPTDVLSLAEAQVGDEV
jgi:hypothetical protein